MALKYIGRMNIELKLFSAEPCAILLDQCDKSTGWMFTFTRTISDLQLSIGIFGLIRIQNPLQPMVLHGSRESVGL